MLASSYSSHDWNRKVILFVMCFIVPINKFYNVIILYKLTYISIIAR